MKSVSMRKINKAWFESELRRTDQSMRMWAKHLKLDPSAVTRMLNGERKMTLSEAAASAIFFGTSMDVILDHAGVPVDRISPIESGMVLIAGTVDSDGQVHYVKFKKEAFADAPPGLSKDAIALKFNSPMSTFDPYDGCIIFFHESGSLSPDAFGRLSVVVTEDERTLVRIPRRGSERGQYSLYDMTGRITEESRLISASPVLWMKM